MIHSWMNNPQMFMQAMN